MEKKFYLGLDIGTDSVGYALLDEHYNLIKKNGHTMWGVRMFEESNGADERRSYRSSRRRIAREKQRVSWLREIFAEEIYKIDKTFFQRLDDSFYKTEDKRNNNYYNVFNDASFTDKEFFNKFPTIFHLKKYLLESNQKEDIRLIYLAISNMMKHRGNFLSESEEFRSDDITSVKNAFEELNEMIIKIKVQNEEEDNYIDSYFQLFEMNDESYKELKNILTSQYGILEKKRKLKECFKVENKTLISECIIPLLAGTSYNASKTYLVKEENYDKCEISLDVEDLQSLVVESTGKINELSEAFNALEYCKIIFDYYYVLTILNESKSISDAMVKKYNQHQKDLKDLKHFIKEYAPEKYNECFRDSTYENNYANYVGFNDVASNKSRRKHCKSTDFYKYIKGIFNEIHNPEAASKIECFTKKMDNGLFLQRQRTGQNGALPMQLNLAELKQILNKQSKYHEFLNSKDENNLTAVEKIISIFKYKIPYYVGPLNKKSEYSWVERTDEKIYPWNFDKVIDKDTTAIKFIERMQNKCTYLKGPDDFCLPKNSLLFSEYNCLSYLNNMINYLGSIDVKNKVFEEVFLRIKKPTKKDIISYLKANYDSDSIPNASMIEEPTCNMSSYITFKEIFGNEFNSKKDIIEQIIKDITIFEDKKILEKRLYDLYKLDTEKIKTIKGLNYKGYGRLSKRLLSELKTQNPYISENGEICDTVIQIMRASDCNLQQILFDNELDLNKTIDEYNKKYVLNSKEDINDFVNDYVSISPHMKRPLVQTYKIIEEIEQIIKHPIDKYFVECTRTNNADKKRTKTRYDKIKDIIAESQRLAQEFNLNLDEINKKLEENKDNLKSDALYLYFTQLGKCMYTMQNIDIDKISTDYDIDHIYPQSVIKDDSLSNRVLVSKKFNNDVKGDKFIFEVSDRLDKSAKPFYKSLLEQDLISKEKYRRLTEKFISKEKLDGFINRQLVTTNQSVKGLIQVLKMKKGVDTSNIVFSKAENVSSFRHMFDIIKSRTANNFHHAHDAYLNVIVGNVLDTYYKFNYVINHSDYERIKNENKTINPDVLFDKAIIKINDNEIWNKEENIRKIKDDIFNRFDISETIRVSNSNIMYSKTTILPAGSGVVAIKSTTPAKSIEKYGGITSPSYSRYVIVENINRKDEKEYILEAIPRDAVLELTDSSIETKQRINRYLEAIGYVNYNVINYNIKSPTIIVYNALKFCFTGKTNDRYVAKNMKDRLFKYSYIMTIKKIDKYFDKIKKKEQIVFDNESIIISPAKNDKTKAVILLKEEVDDLLNYIIKLFNKEIYKFESFESLRNNLNQRIDLGLKENIELINELLKLLKTNERKIANLKLINMSSQSGMITYSKKLLPGMRIIAESMTGYYKKVLFEVPR